VTFVTIGLVMSLAPGPVEYEVNLFVIRSVYLAIAAGLLVNLGRHEAQLRGEVQRLADWPHPTAVDVTSMLPDTISYAAKVLNAGRVLVIWEAGDEPWIQAALWQKGNLQLSRISPEQLAGAMSPSFDSPAFASPAHDTGRRHRPRSAEPDHSDTRVHPVLLDQIGPGPFVSAPLASGIVSGRVFFADLKGAGADLLPVTELVARELGASLARVQAADEHRQIAVREERIRLSRDLHDGVLQSLTGIRLEIESITTALSDESRRMVHARLAAVERALAAEQRELRGFIDGLRPVAPSATDTFAERLVQLRDRLAAFGRAAIEIRLHPPDLQPPFDIAGALLLMVHEAAVNALRHAAPTRIVVEIGRSGAGLAVTVVDDGRGFDFRGRYDHAELERLGAGPITLRERAHALGGTLTVDSADTGARIEIRVPLREPSPGMSL
jgi:signal transduction histidine kinase